MDDDAMAAMAPENMEEKPTDQMMDDDKKSEKSKHSSKKSSKKSSEDSADSRDEEKPKDILEPCCCCLCVCHNERTKNLSCCMFFPVKTGIVLTGGLFLIAVTGMFVWHMFMLMNEHIDWYFPIIALVLLAPMILGATFWVVFFIRDKKASRARLTYSQLLAIISLCTIAAWNVIYFVYFYKKDKEFVYQGLNDGPYKKTQKKTYIFSILFETSVLVAFFAYTMCITDRYSDAMDMSKPYNE